MSRLLFCLFLSAYGVYAQQFDAVSVKVVGRASNKPEVISDPALLELEGVPLIGVLARAYDVGYLQVTGPGRKSMEGVYIDITARIPEGQSDKVPVMMQNMLKDRFRLEVHREDRVVNAYALTVTNPALLKEKGNLASYKGVIERDKQYMRLPNLTMTEVVRWLGVDISAPVIDRTGVDGTYTFWVQQMRDLSYTSEVEESLAFYGLKLVAGKYPLEMLVVDKFDRNVTAN
jgi:uncharacterized protein (TIGR03435 family)